MKTNYGKILRNGILDENPIFRLVLGMCATLAITTSVFNGFGMGMAATFVLVGSNVVISLLRNFIPDKVQYVLAPLPSFWMGKAILEERMAQLLPCFATAAGWIAMLLRRARRKE